MTVEMVAKRGISTGSKLLKKPYTARKRPITVLKRHCTSLGWRRLQPMKDIPSGIADDVFLSFQRFASPISNSPYLICHPFHCLDHILQRHRLDRERRNLFHNRWSEPHNAAIDHPKIILSKHSRCCAFECFAYKLRPVQLDTIPNQTQSPRLSSVM
jgi:hypothetical protein